MFNGDCLRVLSPKTEDGNRPRIGYDGRIEYREDFLPLTARRALERQNSRLPSHLKKIIEPVYTKEIVKPEPATQEFNVGNGNSATVVNADRKKPGPKPKHA